MSLSNLEKNDSMYVCVCAGVVYLHRDEGKSRVSVCVFVCALVKTGGISSHFSLVELGGRETAMM